MRRQDIDTGLVASLIKAQFPHWADLPITSVEPGGWDNRSFRLGDTMVVRLPSAAHYSAQVAKEQRWLPILARELPLPIPVPLALGRPSENYPWHWSVHGWLEGEDAARCQALDSLRFARSLAAFLVALQAIDPRSGPAPGSHNFHRGGPLEHYDRETRAAIANLGGSIDSSRAVGAWEAALASRWEKPPVWVHGDVSPDNLLVFEGELSAVIDFGGCGVGDPACDLAIAWTFFRPSEREAFRAELALDAGTWARARGWALWKALISLAGAARARQADRAKLTLANALDDFDSGPSG